MKITNVKINGIENPIGFKYDYLLCSWNVEEAKGKKQTNAVIEVSTSADFSNIICRKEGDLKQNGEKLEIELSPVQPIITVLQSLPMRENVRQVIS